MVYRQYLFLSLLQNEIPYFESMPYDDQFYVGSTIWRQFVNSKWDDFRKGEYEAIQDYIKDNKDNIILTLKEERNA